MQCVLNDVTLSRLLLLPSLIEGFVVLGFLFCFMLVKSLFSLVHVVLVFLQLVFGGPRNVRRKCHLTLAALRCAAVPTVCRERVGKGA